MDKKKVIQVSVVVGFLGLLSAILGFSAEGANGTDQGRYRLVRNRYGYRWVYTKPQSPQGLGISAAVFILVSQIAISAASGCCGCCTSRAITSQTKYIVGVVVSAIFSWILAVIAFVLFLVGPDQPTGTFAAGGVLALAATALGLTSYIMLRTQPAGTTTVSRDIQPPPVVIMVSQPPQTPRGSEAARGSQSKPGEEQPPAAAGVADPLSSPAAVAGAPNKLLQPTESSVGHMQSEPSTPNNKPAGEHTGVTASQQQAQAPPPHVYVVHPQPQPQGQGAQPLVVGITMDQGQQQLQPPHVYVVNPQQHAQYPVQAGITSPSASLQQGNKPEKQSSIGKELLKAGAELGVHMLVGAVNHGLLSDNTDPLAMAGGALLSVATGGDAGTSDFGDDGSC